MYLTYVFFLTFIIHEFNQIHNINICIDDREKIPGFHTAVKSGVLSLVPEICLVLQLNVSSLKDRIFSFFFLLGIISETADGWLAKYDDDRQVDKCKEAHVFILGLKIENWKRILAGEALLRKFFSKIFSKVFFVMPFYGIKRKMP